MVEQIWQRGPLTGLINNAAANFISPSVDISPRGFAAVRSTVMDGALFSTLACGRRWIEQGLPGSVVSMLVTWVWPGSAYVLSSVMSKTALHAMTMSLAVEWGRYGIRVNGIAPGPIEDTEGMKRLVPEPIKDRLRKGIPLGRFGRIADIERAAVFLCSDAASFINGEVIVVDGGQWLAGNR